MVDIPVKPSLRVSSSLLLYGYAVLLSGAYTFAFWRPFGFNPFPYLSANDVITSPLSNLLILLAPIILIVPVAILDKSGRARNPKSLRLILYIHWLLYFGLMLQDIFLMMNNGAWRADEHRVLALTGLMIMMSYGLWGRYEGEHGQFYFPLLSISLAQLAVVLACGYLNGKTIVSTRSLVIRNIDSYVLNQPSLCGADLSAKWLYLEKYGGYALFYRRDNRALCMSNSQSYGLTPLRIPLQRVSP